MLTPEEQKLETLKELPWCRFHKEYLFVEPPDGLKRMVSPFTHASLALSL